MWRSVLPLILVSACGSGGSSSTGQPPPSTSQSITDKPSYRPSPKIVRWLPDEDRLAITVTRTARDIRFLAVGKDGTAFATTTGGGQGQLYASTDNARTWQRRGEPLQSGSFRVMTALSSGTLLADIAHTTGHVIARSNDGGRTWTEVLPIGAMSLLTPHSVDELDGTVFLGEYQAYTDASVPVKLWASADDGRSWELRQTFADRRHCHGVRVDPVSHTLWVFFGDNEQRTGMVRSKDGGRTFEKVLIGRAGSAVDAVFTPQGILFGQDVVFGSDPSYVQLFTGHDQPQRLLRLPGPSYSIHPSPVGGLLLTTTREPAGDVYLPGDDSAHLLVSADGSKWEDVMQLPRIGTLSYGRANIYWTLPSKEVVLQTSDVQPVGDGYGYLLLKVERQ
jgi:photosystem II stability/assembly factor-like uncharacterized protein